MFRTVPLSIISSFSLYTQQWYMSYRFADSLRAGKSRNWSSLPVPPTSPRPTKAVRAKTIPPGPLFPPPPPVKVKNTKICYWFCGTGVGTSVTGWYSGSLLMSCGSNFASNYWGGVGSPDRLSAPLIFRLQLKCDGTR